MSGVSRRNALPTDSPRTGDDPTRAATARRACVWSMAACARRSPRSGVRWLMISLMRTGKLR
jgi:hypothetical protein